MKRRKNVIIIAVTLVIIIVFLLMIKLASVTSLFSTLKTYKDEIESSYYILVVSLTIISICLSYFYFRRTAMGRHPQKINDDIPIDKRNAFCNALSRILHDQGQNYKHPENASH